MQDFCPLCLKNGIKKKIKLFQINLQEAVQICEEEKCRWPFGYEDFVISQRVVGKIWSCYWNDCKPAIPRFKENVTSIKPSLCNTFMSPIKHASNECSASLNTHCSENINDITRSSNVTDSKSDFTSSHISTCDDGSITHINNKEQCKDDKNILHKEITTSNICLNNSNLQSINNIIKNTKIENERINLLNKHIKEKDGTSMQNIKNGSNVKGIPKITSIEKTNIDISNVKIENQISVYQEPDKKSSSKPTNSAKAKLISEIDRLPNIRSTKNNETMPKSNINVTIMEIDGLPPITLSFEIPVCTVASETVISNTPQTDYKNINIKQNNPELKNTFLRRNISSGKQYEKFSFSAIKKKVESCNSINTNTNNNNVFNIKTKTKIEDIESNLTNNVKQKNCSKNFNTSSIESISNNDKQSIPNLNSCISNQLDNSITILSNQEDASSDTSAVNTSVNIDTALEDFLTNDYNASEDINDEWINSLLS